MKYIKKFESTDMMTELPKLKKYVLYKANTNTYFILEITGYENTYIATKKLYIYTLLLDKLRKGKHQYYNININRVHEIVYDSDNLKDVVDIIPTLKEIDKYNL